MATIAIIGAPMPAMQWVADLTRLGHDVVRFEDTMLFMEQFAERPLDILILDVARPDQGEALMISQARAQWPDCRVLAITSGYTFRSSAVFQMGLWKPDHLLLHPVGERMLSATVAFLWAQQRNESIRRRLSQIHRTQKMDAAVTKDPGVAVTKPRLAADKRRLA